MGAGAIGTYVGGRLAVSGQRPVFLGRAAAIDHWMESGLQVTDLDGKHGNVPGSQLLLAHTVPEAMEALDCAGLAGPLVVLLCVKGRGTASAAADIAKYCTAGTVVVSLQNGVDNVDRIRAEAPHMVAVPGMVPFNVVNNPTHTVHRATSGVLCIGDGPLSREIAQVFNAAGIETQVASDMRAVQWGKLLLNLGNPVNALSDMPLLEQLQDRSYRRVLASLQAEALSALASAGIRPAKVANAPPALLPHILRLPNWLFLRIAARMLKIDATARSSMWEDVQHGRPTEIDDLCGAVVRLAKQQGLQAPKNEAMCRLIATYRKGQRMSGPAIASALASRVSHATRRK